MKGGEEFQRGAQEPLEGPILGGPHIKYWNLRAGHNSGELWDGGGVAQRWAQRWVAR